MSLADDDDSSSEIIEDAGSAFAEVLPLFGGALPYGIFRLNQSHLPPVRVSAVSQSDERVPRGLFAAAVWHGAVLLAEYLRDDPALVRGKTVCEVSAGAALPSVVAARLGASFVLATDYPNDVLLANIVDQFAANEIAVCSAAAPDATVAVAGHTWGDVSDADMKPLLDHPIMSLAADGGGGGGGGGYDLVLFAECLWMDTYPLHEAMLASAARLVRPGSGRVLFAFTHHNPGREAEDLELFERARGPDFGFEARTLVSSRRGNLDDWSQVLGAGGGGRGGGGGAAAAGANKDEEADATGSHLLADELESQCFLVELRLPVDAPGCRRHLLLRPPVGDGGPVDSPAVDGAGDEHEKKNGEEQEEAPVSTH